ncbi:MAG: hypothetical protein LPJ87_07450, partial [Zoogloeaceae bacterium]|nr:hypothetical protein [Zoogloeaceae bacterium]
LMIAVMNFMVMGISCDRMLRVLSGLACHFLTQSLAGSRPSARSMPVLLIHYKTAHWASGEGEGGHSSCITDARRQ